MSDLTNAITSINQAAERAENTSDFLDDWSTFDNESYVTNPNNNETVSSAAKQIKDLVDEELPGLIDGVEANAESAAESASSASESMDSASASATTASEASATAVAASESASESEANVTEIESDLNELYEDLSNTVIPDGPNGSDGAEYGFAITDETGQVIHSVSNDGKVTSIETTTYKEKNPNTQQSTIDPYGQMSSSTGLDGSNTITTVSFEEQPDSSSDFVIVDSKGRECLRVDEYGALDTSPTKYGEFVQAQDMFIESYGQSLSAGASSYAVVSTSQTYNNIMFESGVRYLDDQVLTSYVPLIEQLSESGTTGETPCSGITDYASSADDNYTTNGTRYIGSASGMAGQQIYRLMKGLSVYARMIERVQAGYDLSVSEGRSFNVPCSFFTQAEADYAAGTDADVWKSYLIELQKDLNLDYAAITGQTFKAPMFFYQCATNRNRGADYPSIGLVQGSFSGQNDMFCACAMYNFNYHDNLHLEAESYYRLGWYYGKAFDDWKNTGEVKCLRIKEAVTYGTFIDVWLDVPVGPVVIDTDQVTETDGYGFIIYDQNKDPILDIVSSVEVTGPDRLKINLTESVEKGKYLTYAFGDGSEGTVSGATAGPRGNIRDSQGDTMTITDQAGNVSRGDNWLLISEVLLK